MTKLYMLPFLICFGLSVLSHAEDTANPKFMAIANAFAARNSATSFQCYKTYLNGSDSGHVTSCVAAIPKFGACRISGDGAECEGFGVGVRCQESYDVDTGGLTGRITKPHTVIG